jgi:hypothetical protein
LPTLTVDRDYVWNYKRDSEIATALETLDAHPYALSFSLPPTIRKILLPVTSMAPSIESTPETVERLGRCASAC